MAGDFPLYVFDFHCIHPPFGQTLYGPGNQTDVAKDMFSWIRYVNPLKFIDRQNWSTSYSTIHALYVYLHKKDYFHILLQNKGKKQVNDLTTMVQISYNKPWV